LLHKEDANRLCYHHTQKDPTNSEKEAVIIFKTIATQNRLMKKLLVVLLINYSPTNLGEVGRYRMNKKIVDIPMEKQVLTKEDIITIVKYLIELINAKS
jgi:DNA-directed RNA polymerase subunit beta